MIGLNVVLAVSLVVDRVTGLALDVGRVVALVVDRVVCVDGREVDRVVALVVDRIVTLVVDRLVLVDGLDVDRGVALVVDRVVLVVGLDVDRVVGLDVDRVVALVVDRVVIVIGLGVGVVSFTSARTASMKLEKTEMSDGSMFVAAGVGVLVAVVRVKGEEEQDSRQAARVVDRRLLPSAA